ncbi:UPF0729 protein GD16342 [Scaptodrosophila lebanonensis]|uniref:UPF0729 protein GD16342 n=1 Tax=Drosophila lebanonensis TaxID=7225 RepID=A0A6J2U2M3_DROLE|nr:UPF0729 protein GD16342 [Scaptodrosophila lebanonensis]XP_030381377.1 UPF0729 protein GD16342 [Scaptodrosophila lebanonensis]
MVCVPCFIIPLLLYIWHKFVQPIILRYWNPWEKKDAQGNVVKAGPEFPFACKGGVCPFVPSGNKPKTEDGAQDAAPSSTSAEGGNDVPTTATTTAKVAVEAAAESKKQI